MLNNEELPPEDNEKAKQTNEEKLKNPPPTPRSVKKKTWQGVVTSQTMHSITEGENDLKSNEDELEKARRDMIKMKEELEQEQKNMQIPRFLPKK